MANNGKMFKVVMYLVGVLVTLLIAAMLFLGKNVIANDKESRTRDTVLGEKIHVVQQEINGHLDDIKTKQNKAFTDILVSLERLKVKIEENNSS